MTVKLDSAAIAKILKEDVRDAVNAAARSVEANLDARGEPVEVREYTTDRAAAAVSIASAAGLAIQAKHGALTRAAAAAGLEVREKPQ